MRASSFTAFQVPFECGQENFCCEQEPGGYAASFNPWRVALIIGLSHQAPCAFLVPSVPVGFLSAGETLIFSIIPKSFV